LGHSKPSVHGFIDADWASYPETRRSTDGYLFTILGTAIIWKRKRQLTVSRSYTEFEYIALSLRTQEAVWLGLLLQELDHSASSALPLHHNNARAHRDLQPHLHPLKIFYDNQSSLKLARNPLFHSRTKHIEVAHHFVREKALGGQISLDYISTDSQPAGILTKALPRIKFERHKAALGMTSLAEQLPYRSFSTKR
jgi:hypothetical protein